LGVFSFACGRLERDLKAGRNVLVARL